MARPSVKHDGFLIPNAKDVNNPRMAEPDAVDFSTLAHPLWGVVEGCEVTCTGTTANVKAGTALVNGQLINLAMGSVELGTGGTQDRFDLVVATAGGLPTKVPGIPATDPVFPDPPADVTVLAAVFCPASGSSYVENVIDKRKFVSKSLLTKIGLSEELIRNVNGTGNHYLLDGSGKSVWENDTWMWRSSPETLKVHKHLGLEGSLDIDGEITVDGKVQSGGLITGTNLKQAMTPPGTGNPADLWQNPSTGKVYIRQNNTWQEMATIQSANPPGTVITSLELPSVMRPLGWLPLNGTEVTEDDYPSLFQVQGLAHLVQNTSPRKMILPNAQKLILLTDFTSNPGLKVSTNPENKVTLKEANLPRHGHSPNVQPGGGSGGVGVTTTTNRKGGHNHKVDNGPHTHEVSEQPHAHEGMDLAGNAVMIIALQWGGHNKIDAEFNDRNHTYSVDAYQWTRPAKTNLAVTATGSGHVHDVSWDGDHDHAVTLPSVADHDHLVTETMVGASAPFDITPESLTVYSYIRT